MKAPELEPNSGWVNTDRPLSIHGDPDPSGSGGGLRGHVVLLEFFSPGRVACDHMLDDLAWFEEKYGGEPLVIVGVCSTETEAEEAVGRVTHDVRRRRVRHPVVIDRHFRIWRAYSIRAWPSVALIDPTGEVVGQIGGVGNRMLIDRYIGRLLADHRLDGTLAAVRAGLGADPEEVTERGLRYPTGVSVVPPAVGAPGRLCVSDTGNDRVIVSAWPDAAGRAEVTAVYGGGGAGFGDGAGEAARFCEPGGIVEATAPGRVLVADARNHAVRMLDLKARTVRTVAGTGSIGDPDQRGGAIGTQQALRSPSGLALDATRQRVLIAMTGHHRVWSIDLTTMVTRAYAGSGVAGVVDGVLDKARFHEPVDVAVASDGSRAYVLDGVGCAVREIDFEAERVRTVIGRVGTADEEPSVLADAGDADGAFPAARLRHPRAMALWATTPMHATGDRLLVADTRNGKIRLVNPHETSAETWADGLASPSGIGVGTPRLGDGRPAAVFVAETDAHRVLRYDAATREVTAVEFVGL